MHEIWQSRNDCPAAGGRERKLRARPDYSAVAHQRVLRAAIRIEHRAEVVLLDPAGKRVDLASDVSAEKDADDPSVQSIVVSRVEDGTIRHPAPDHARHTPTTIGSSGWSRGLTTRMWAEKGHW